MLHLVHLQRAWLAALALAKALRTQADPAPFREPLRAALGLDRADFQQWLEAPGMPDYLKDLAQAWQLTAADHDAEAAAQALAKLRAGVQALALSHPGEFSAVHAKDMLDG
jgi:hypothetical protein